VRKTYPDMLFNDTGFLMFKGFYHKDVMDGPLFYYSQGKLGRKGFMRNGKEDGQQEYYNDSGKLRQRFIYTEGKKTGTWAYYDSKGRLYKKVYYDKNSQFVKQEIYDRNGQLVRTELQESRFY
jgi:antitoxin component YwqK of YwqJK toxin-antitoxin module